MPLVLWGLTALTVVMTLVALYIILDLAISLFW